MVRKAFVMSLNKGCEAEYERRHDEIWADLVEVLHEHGVSNYSIFLDHQTNTLFAYAEIEDESRWVEIAKTEECQKWWAFMKDIMPTNHDNSPVSHELDEVFHMT